MPPTRIDRLLAELTQRYSLQPDFIERLRPSVTLILSPEIGEETRLDLLGLLAETCERDQRLRRDFAAIRTGLDKLFPPVGEAEGG